MTCVSYRQMAWLAGLVLGGTASVLADTPDAAKPQEAKEQYTLCYKFQPGQMLRWKVVHRARVDASVSGVSQTSESVTCSVKVWKVGKVASDGTATFEQMVENVDMWQKLTGRVETRYNSATDKKPPTGFEGVAKSIGVPLSKTTIDTHGKVIERRNLAPKANAPQEGLLTIPLPESPIAIGETWSYPCDVEVPLEGGRIRKVKSRQTFTLEAVKDSVATIRVATQILTPIDDPAVEAQLVQRDSAGTVEFDMNAGRVVGQHMDTDKRVVGFRGHASSLHYRTQFTEELIAKVAQSETSGPTIAPTKADNKKPSQPEGAKAPTASAAQEKPTTPTVEAAKPSTDRKTSDASTSTKSPPLASVK